MKYILCLDALFDYLRNMIFLGTSVLKVSPYCINYI